MCRQRSEPTPASDRRLRYTVYTVTSAFIIGPDASPFAFAAAAAAGDRGAGGRGRAVADRASGLRNGERGASDGPEGDRRRRSVRSERRGVWGHVGNANLRRARRREGQTGAMCGPRGEGAKEGL